MAGTRVGGHLLASPWPAWDAGARKSASALDASHSTPERLRHRTRVA